jgi:hypothetical protein
MRRKTPYLIGRASDGGNIAECIDLPSILCFAYCNDLLQRMANVINVDLGISSIPVIYLCESESISKVKENERWSEKVHVAAGSAASTGKDRE